MTLNFRYHVLKQRSLDQSLKAIIYEETEIPCSGSESSLSTAQIGTVDAWIEELASYEYITFDVFDTLIFRPFSAPTDLFYFLGETFEVMKLKGLRKEMEYQTRLIVQKERGTMEVTLAEIWQMMEQEIGIPAQDGMKAELTLERRFCYANPFMLEVWKSLIAMGKKPIVVSDMYLPSDFLKEILDANGFSGYERLLVSCEEGISKSDGRIFEKLKKDVFGNSSDSKLSWIHIGDNLHSDVKMARQAGAAIHLYPNVDQAGNKCRAFDMSPIIGGAYRGLVNHTLYNGINSYSMEYEYGFIYGGLFAVGYCKFIHEYCEQHGINRILFLSRDGDILEKVYRKLYPQADTRYVYWSRLAGMKLMAAYDKNDYFRRFIDHKVNQGKTIRQILQDMELLEDNAYEADTLSQTLSEDSLSLEDLLTDKNADDLKAFLQKHFDKVVAAYQPQMSSAKAYYESKLCGCKKAVAVDIGWAGSGAMALSFLTENVWKIPCKITGLIAGTNTVHNAEPDASEMFLLTGKLVSYLYSQADNRDLLKKHDPAKGYNVFWELLLASPTRQFCGFYSSSVKAKEEMLKDESLIDSDVPGVALRFGDSDPNQDGMREVQQGILDFTDLWLEHFSDFPYMFNISGRDAYAPLLAAAGKDEKYLNEIRKKFDLKENIN